MDIRPIDLCIMLHLYGGELETEVFKQVARSHFPKDNPLDPGAYSPMWVSSVAGGRWRLTETGTRRVVQAILDQLLGPPVY